MRTLFFSVGHNWAKTAKGVDTGANAFETSEALEVQKLIIKIIDRKIKGLAIIKVPYGFNLVQRIAFINNTLRTLNPPEPFAFEFHLDAGPIKATGASVWYNDNNTYTYDQGTKFLREYTRITGLPSRHVNSDKTNRLGDLGFVSQVKCASLLIELGFITNQLDLKTIREKAADGIVAGINAMG